MEGFIRLTADAFKKGWHERNGGNLTYRVKPEEVEAVKDSLHEVQEWLPIGNTVPGLAGEYFLVTGSGKYMRNVELAPEENVALIKIDEKGENYGLVWGLVKGGRPTSELPTHLAKQDLRQVWPQVCLQLGPAHLHDRRGHHLPGYQLLHVPPGLCITTPSGM